MTRTLRSQEFKDKLLSIVADDAPRKLVEELAEYSLCLEQQLILLENYRFGRSSERFVDPRQMEFFNEAEKLEAEVGEDDSASEGTDENAAAKGDSKKKRRPKIELSEALPRNVVVHELKPEDRRCPCCDEPMAEIGAETTEKLHVVAPKIEVKCDVYKKYACKSCQEAPAQAPRPESALSHIKASTETVAFIATQKYVFGTPLYRLEQLFSSAGVTLSRYVMSLWMIKLAGILRPVYEALEKALLSRDYMHMDETTLQVLREPGRPATSKSQIWIRTSGVHSSQGPPIALYTYDPSRSAAVAERLIEGFRGILQTDDYSGYSSALKGCDQITHVLCWDHARRYFWEALQAISKEKRPSSTSGQALKLIGQLYAIEEECKPMSAIDRQCVREKLSSPVLEKLKKFCSKKLDDLSTSSPTAVAIKYMLSNWEKLTLYTTDGRINISNNPAEQRVRPFAVGRKNFLFSNTPRGAEASAIIYSVVETMKLNGKVPLNELVRLISLVGSKKKSEELTIKEILPK